MLLGSKTGEVHTEWEPDPGFGNTSGRFSFGLLQWLPSWASSEGKGPSLNGGLVGIDVRCVSNDLHASVRLGPESIAGTAY